GSPTSETEGLLVPAFEVLLELGHELRSVRAIDQAVVVAEAEEHHRADRDRVASVLVGDYHRPLDDGLDVEDRLLALGGRQRAEQRAEHAGIRDRERAAA